jgi:Protein of unknown function (DUF1573)
MRISLIFVISLFLLVGCREENKQITSDFIHFPPSSGQNSDEKLPIIQFDSTTLRFGTLAIGEKLDHTFRFTNTGQAPLMIAQVSPSCGCTVPRNWTRDPIAPGGSGEISVTFNSKGNAGQVEKSITVLTNCIPAATKLSIVGFVSGVESSKDQPSPIEMEMTH